MLKVIFLVIIIESSIVFVVIYLYIVSITVSTIRKLNVWFKLKCICMWTTFINFSCAIKYNFQRLHKVDLASFFSFFEYLKLWFLITCTRNMCKGITFLTMCYLFDVKKKCTPYSFLLLNFLMFYLYNTLKT